MAVDVGFAKRFCTYVFHSVPEVTSEEASGDTHPRLRQRRSGGESATFGSRSVRSATNMITIDGRDSVNHDPISLVSKSSASMASKDLGGTQKGIKCVGTLVFFLLGRIIAIATGLSVVEYSNAIAPSF